MEPIKISMRKTSLTAYGGTLTNLYKSFRLDKECINGGRSRRARTATRKDYRTNGSRNYRPWQSLKKAQYCN